MLRKDDRTYVLERDGAIERINAYRVTYAPPSQDAKDQHETTTEQHDIVKNTEGPTQIVEKILDLRRDIHGSLEFLVKGYAYNEKTWEPRCNIPEELASRYFTKQTRTTRELKAIFDG